MWRAFVMPGPRRVPGRAHPEKKENTMSTATMDHGLYAVPPATTQQERLGLLLRIKRGARRALDTVLALPRGAAGWVLRHARSVLSALGTNPTLARIGNRLRDLAGLIRAAGPIPATLALVSIPAVWRATVRAAGWLGGTIATAAGTLWRWTSATLIRFGPGGARVAAALANAGAGATGFLARVLAHPISQAVARGLTALARLVRPVSQSLVTHRLLGRLIATPWLRIALEVLTLPFIAAPGLTGTLSRRLRPVPVVPTQPTGTPTPATSARTTPATGDVTATVAEESTTLLEPQNRAERRARQQPEAHAKRAGARR